jgi:CRP-like cAMP-binding protein
MRRVLGVDWRASSWLGLKLKSLGAQAEDLDALLQAVKRCVSVAAHENVIRETDAGRQVTILLSGTTCSYKREEDGGRRILSFQHAGDFCDLHRYVLPNLEPAMGVQALTDCTVAVIDYFDMDRLLLRPTLASAFWRASMLEAASYRARLTSIGRGTALERVAHLLCEQLARREAVGLGAHQLPFSQIDVADAAGLSVVHVNRTIQTLRTLNVLSKARHALEVVNRKELEKIAGFEDHYLGMPNFVSKWAVEIEATGPVTLPQEKESRPPCPAPTGPPLARSRREPRSAYGKSSSISGEPPGHRHGKSPK